MLDARQALSRYNMGTLAHDLLERFIGQERIDKLAVEGFRGSLQALEIHRPGRLSVLERDDPGLRYPHALCELSGRHPQTLPDRPDPAGLRLGCKLGDRTQLGKTLIQMPTEEGSVELHVDNLIMSIYTRQ
jgi:hypothetical protein